MTDGRTRNWWDLVEDHLTRGDHHVADGLDADDPWSDELAAPALTDEQRTLLGGIDDQPGVARFGSHDHDHDDQPPVPRFTPRGEASDDTTDDDGPAPTTGNIPGDTP
jgi:hypothetical protein